METKLAYKPTKSFVSFLKQVTTKHNLTIIRKEVTLNDNRRTVSQSLLGVIRLFEPTTHDNCHADTTCIRELVEAYATITDAKVWLPLLNKLITTVSTNINSEAELRTEINNILKVKLRDFDYTQYFSLSREKQIARTVEHQAHVVQMHENVIDLSENDLLEFKNAIVNSTNLYDMISLVQICVGSRFIEVLQVSEYEESKRDGYVIVRGLAKESARDYIRQADNVGRVDRSGVIEKPILFVTLRKIQETVHAIRRTIAHEIEGKSLKQITAKYNKNANTRLNTFRGFEKVTTHFLRKVYGNYSYDTLSDQSVTRNRYLTTVLGHKASSITTSLSYSAVRIIRAPRIIEHDAKTLIAELLVEIKELKQRVSDLDRKSVV